MAIGLVSDEELEQELINSQPLSDKGEVIHRDIPTPGRKSGDNNVPAALRNIIADEALAGGRKSGLELASSLGISSSSVSAYVKGATSTASVDRPDKDLSFHVEESKARIAKSAREKIEMALDAITREKLGDTSPRVAAGVAKDMSAVVKNMEPANQSDGSNRTQFVFMVPHMRKEEDFSVIDVKG